MEALEGETEWETKGFQPFLLCVESTQTGGGPGCFLRSPCSFGNLIRPFTTPMSQSTIDRCSCKGHSKTSSDYGQPSPAAQGSNSFILLDLGETNGHQLQFLQRPNLTAKSMEGLRANTLFKPYKSTTRSSSSALLSPFVGGEYRKKKSGTNLF